MYIEQLYTGCLAEAAYYVESEGEAVIIDPLRDTTAYIELAKKRGAVIKYILETHFHADFVSGHLELARKTGGEIVYGPNANPNFDFKEVKDGDELALGKVKFRILHTPGHTMESTTYLLLDANGKEHAIFTGDTLFIGDVGRPDLAVKSDLSTEDLAGHLFDSLRNKIMPLPDDVIIYPAHGQGSACGKNMSKDRHDTLGNQKVLNYALDAKLSKEEFIKILTADLSPAPQYFPKNVLLNQNGYDLLDDIRVKGKRGLEPDEFLELSTRPGYLILDTRKPSEFAKGHIPGSLFVGIDGGFAPWVGTLIEDLDTPILLVADETRLEEVITRLSRVGYDNPQGYLKGGIEAWVAENRPLETMQEVDAEYVEEHFEELKNRVVDVRKPGEYGSKHISGVPNLPLDDIYKNKDTYNAGEKYYLHCAGGYRSVIAGSILQKHGIGDVVNVIGGFNSLKSTDIPMEEAVTSS